jgi:hypothetical protein
MESDRFAALTRTLAHAASRRSALKGFLGLGMAAIGAASLTPGAGAARRGFSGPKLPTPDTCSCPPNHVCVGGVCFQLCIECPCGTCSVIPGGGPNLCVEGFYATEGSCVGKCEAGYGCNGQNICLQPCQL